MSGAGYSPPFPPCLTSLLAECQNYLSLTTNLSSLDSYFISNLDINVSTTCILSPYFRFGFPYCLCG